MQKELCAAAQRRAQHMGSHQAEGHTCTVQLVSGSGALTPCAASSCHFSRGRPAATCREARLAARLD